jgi:hypothetical protein
MFTSHAHPYRERSCKGKEEGSKGRRKGWTNLPKQDMVGCQVRETDATALALRNRTTRNLFLIDYKAKHPKVMKFQFNAMWEKLPVDDPETFAVWPSLGCFSGHSLML